MQHGAVEGGRGRRGDVHGVHAPLHVGLRHGGAPGAPAAPGERLRLRAFRVVGLGVPERLRGRAGSASRHCSS